MLDLYGCARQIKQNNDKINFLKERYQDESDKLIKEKYQAEIAVASSMIIVWVILVAILIYLYYITIYLIIDRKKQMSN